MVTGLNPSKTFVAAFVERVGPVYIKYALFTSKLIGAQLLKGVPEMLILELGHVTFVCI